MSSLWTPSGEHPVDRSKQPTSTAPPHADAGEPASTPDERAAAEAYARQLDAARQQVLDTPAALVIAQQALQFYEVAALHLDQPEPKLEEARLAIDAFVAVVDGLGPRLGDTETPLRQAANQIQLAFVEASSAGSSSS